MIIFDVWNLLLVLLCFIGFNLRSTLGLVKQERLIEKGMFLFLKYLSDVMVAFEMAFLCPRAIFKMMFADW